MDVAPTDVLSRAAVEVAEAFVPRLIHVSSAAVQERMDPLDETATLRPFSPYSSSKAAGELVLSGSGVELPDEVI